MNFGMIPSFRFVSFLLCNVLSTAIQSTWISCYHFCCHVVSVLSFIEMIFHSRENCVISARKGKEWGKKSNSKQYLFARLQQKKLFFLFLRKIFSSWNCFTRYYQSHLISQLGDSFCRCFFLSKSQSISQSNFWYQQLFEAFLRHFSVFTVSETQNHRPHTNRIEEIPAIFDIDTYQKILHTRFLLALVFPPLLWYRKLFSLHSIHIQIAIIH